MTYGFGMNGTRPSEMKTRLTVPVHRVAFMHLIDMPCVDRR